MPSLKTLPALLALPAALSLMLSACGKDDLRQTCPEMKDAEKREVAAYSGAHAPADSHISVLAFVRPVSGVAAFDPGQMEPGLWIPPASVGGFAGPDSSLLTPKPDTLAAVQVVSTGSYVAKVLIYDSRNRLVRVSIQAFGQHGELQNPVRAVPKGFVSYLAWDGWETSGVRASDGIYLWEINFAFTGGESYQARIKTALSNGFCEP